LEEEEGGVEEGEQEEKSSVLDLAFHSEALMDLVVN
jgi:hypothetical protein